MQWGDLAAELWLYLPLVGLLLVCYVLAMWGITSSLRARNRPGGIEYEFSSSEPEGIRQEFAASEADASHVDRPVNPSRPMRAADVSPPMQGPARHPADGTD